jgi:type I restriction enzyme M protein
MDGFGDKVAFIWSVADLLRGDYKAHEYGRVILPLAVLRRLDATLAPTKAAVLVRDAELERQGLHNRAKVLERVAGVPFYNTSTLDFRRLLDDPDRIGPNLRTYIAGFSPGAAGVWMAGTHSNNKRQSRQAFYDEQARQARMNQTPGDYTGPAGFGR